MGLQPNWIIFDAADTLLRPEPHMAQVYQRVAAVHGVHLTSNEIANRFRHAIRKHFADAVSSEELDYGRWRNLVFDVLETSNEAIFDSLWNHFAKATSWRLYEDVATVWRWLQQNGYRLAIASNFDRRLLGIVQSLSPIHSAEHVFISSQLGFRKPNSHFFHAIERELGEEPGQLMLIGDRLHADFKAARNAGWQALHLDRADRRASFPKIHRLTGIREYLRPQA